MQKLLRYAVIFAFALTVLAITSNWSNPMHAALPPKKTWGYLDKKGNWAIPRQFSRAGKFSEGTATVIPRDQNLCGFIDKSGDLIIKPQYDAENIGTSFQSGLARIVTGGKFGFIDRAGDPVVKPQFDDCGDFHEGLARVKQGENWGYIATDGHSAINATYKSAGNFSEGVACVQLPDGGWVCIDKTGKLVVAENVLKGLTYPEEFHEGLASITGTNHKYGFINCSGALVIKPQFAIVHAFRDGRALAMQKYPLDSTGPGSSDYGYIDRHGEFAIKPKFADAADFHEGLARVKMHDRWGFIDKTGNFVIEPKFDDAHDFHEGLATVVQDRRYIFIDRTGKTTIDIDCTEAGDFSEGLAPCAK